MGYLDELKRLSDKNYQTLPSQAADKAYGSISPSGIAAPTTSSITSAPTAASANSTPFSERAGYAGLVSGLAGGYQSAVDPQGTSITASAVGGAAKGAATGFAVGGGPVGAAVGGALGLFSGVLGASNRRRQQEQAAKAEAAKVGAQLANEAANTRLRFGSRSTSYSEKRGLKF